jgi:hypothetical protein
MAKKPQIPLKDILRALDKKDRKFYNNLSADQKKAFSPWLMLRYASTVQEDPEHFLIMTNEVLNSHYMDIKDPELQWLLLTVIGQGKVRNHSWLKAPNGKRKTDRVSQMLYDMYPHIKSDEIDLIKSLNTDKDLKQLALNHGYDDKQIKEIFK